MFEKLFSIFLASLFVLTIFTYNVEAEEDEEEEFIQNVAGTTLATLVFQMEILIIQRPIIQMKEAVM